MENNGLEQAFADAFRATGYVTHDQAYELADVAMIELATLQEELYVAEKEIDEIQKYRVAADQQNAALIASIIALPDEFKSLSGSENTAGVYACIDYISDWIAELARSTESGAIE